MTFKILKLNRPPPLKSNSKNILFYASIFDIRPPWALKWGPGDP